MKRYIHTLIIMAALSWGTSPARSQSCVGGVAVDNLNMERNDAYLSVSMELDLSGMEVRKNRAVLLTPRLVNGDEAVELPSVAVYGRRRYYYYIRQDESMLSGKDEISYRASQKPDRLDYRQLVPYQKWMDGADLTLRCDEYGCCNTILCEQDGLLGHHSETFFPELVYVRPDAEREKAFDLEGSAFIDFPVNRTEIYPEYRRNVGELGKIRATIDSVRYDKDITITGVWLKGYASPEGSYSHNTELAMGRTAALRDYIMNLYRFDAGIISTAYEPEDWEGLRRYVESSTELNYRGGILELIDSYMEPDTKEARIKANYPEDYRFLLQNCYPALRHTDYRVSYTIRTYSDVEEIKRIMKTQPQKLSMNEFYLVAQEYEPGSDEFTEVFETAVRLFPDDPTANLNAANAAIRRDDYRNAGRYLEKAGDSAEATYARAALAIREQDFDTARRYLEQAKTQGLEQAGITLDDLNRGRR